MSVIMNVADTLASTGFRMSSRSMWGYSSALRATRVISAAASRPQTRRISSAIG